MVSKSLYLTSGEDFNSVINGSVFYRGRRYLPERERHANEKEVGNNQAAAFVRHGIWM